MFLLIFYIVGWATGIALLFYLGESVNTAEILLKSQLFFGVGIGLIFNAIWNLFQNTQPTKTSGKTPQEFQWEVSFVSLGIGLSGLLAPFFSDNFSIAVIIIVTAFLLGTLVAHVFTRMTKNGVDLITQLAVIAYILLPITLIALCLLWRMDINFEILFIL